MRSLIIFLLASSLTLFAQHGAGMGHAGAMKMNHGHSATAKMGSHSLGTQQPLKQSQLDSGAWRMLQRKTQLGSAALQTMYAQSGAKNFGQFVAAMMVSKNMGFTDQQRLDLLNDLKTMSLGQALQKVGGIQKTEATKQLRKANQEIKDADKNS